MPGDQPPVTFRLEPATEREVPLLLGFIKELAAYEQLADDVVATEADLHACLFGPARVAHAVIAYVQDEPAGFAVYFFTFSTFLARPGLYLEDLFVKPTWRRARDRARPPRASGAHCGRARVRTDGMVGTELERAGARRLPRDWRAADERVDGAAPDRGPARGAGGNCANSSSTVTTVTGSRRSGAISASGSSTNRRSRNRGCGTVSRGSSNDGIPEQQQIQIQRPRGAGEGPLASALPVRSRAARRAIRARSQRGVADGRRVEKQRLEVRARRPDRFRTMEETRKSVRSGGEPLEANAR